MDQDRYSEGGEKWSYSGCILKEMRELACGDSCSKSIPGRKESSAKALRWECVWRNLKKQTNKQKTR